MVHDLRYDIFGIRGSVAVTEICSHVEVLLSRRDRKMEVRSREILDSVEGNIDAGEGRGHVLVGVEMALKVNVDDAGSAETSVTWKSECRFVPAYILGEHFVP